MVSLNLITDPWIPVRCDDGSRRIIAPWQMAEEGILFPDWVRPDLNVACLELLVGLVYLADPPANKKDWRARRRADPERLKTKLAAYEPAFHLLGDGPRFLQDMEKLSGSPNPVDMLFIDSAGGQTMRNNIDVMVHRSRYSCLSLPEAAMALYTLQDFAPSGGAGNRTSMRGGGPLVTLLDPGEELWDLVWLNVPFGQPSDMKDLPWMRPTRTSEPGRASVYPSDEKRHFDVEAFFGMPRRLRLVGDDEGITGVIQRPYGTNYAGWRHPLSPYYRLKVTEDWLPRHPRAGRFGYRNWLGIIAEGEPKKAHEERLASLALIVREWCGRERGDEASVIVAGWAMNNMSPRDFVYSRQPLSRLSEDAEEILRGFIEAAEMVAAMLNWALSSVLDTGEAREAQREEFYLKTEPDFYHCFHQIAAGEKPSEEWLKVLRKQALGQFEAVALPGLSERDMQSMKKIAEARKLLNIELWGYGKKAGPALFTALGLPVPQKKRKAA
ncbi:type I-E CRISPR-associated protein Cse1/CasA [Bombella apis]|nr:type I-E CRISPR-associated protein Cse1/CasA [Bombella apis]